MIKILANIIYVIHILIILFVVIIPFTNSNYLLFIHSIFVPLLILHWICNNNICALTLIEKKIRRDIYKEKDDENCFTCKLIEPIYDFKKNYKEYTIALYIITISLWLISSGKLYYKYSTKNITELKDLFTI